MKKKRYLLFFLLIAAVICIFALDMRFKTVEYNIISPKIAGEVRLALVTDLHSCYYGEEQSKLVDKITQYAPDAVLLVGDIFDDDLDSKNAETFVKSVSKDYKTYYVSGNHEWWSDEMYEFFDFLEKNSVTVLRGKSDVLKVGENDLVISGIDDPDVDEYDDTYMSWNEQLNRVGECVDTEYFNILLSHRPEKVWEYFKYDFDLVLSGHAHGGQFRIPFILNGLYAPNQGLFPEYAGGEYDFDGDKLIVSRGLSRENQLVPRIFNRPELVFVTLSEKRRIL